MIPQRSRFFWLVGFFIVGILLIDIMPFRLPTAIYLVLIFGVILLVRDILIFNQSGFLLLQQIGAIIFSVRFICLWFAFKSEIIR